MDADRLICFYFQLGMTQPEILCCLAFSHNMLMSERTLKRRLSKMGLFRRKNMSPLTSVASFIKRVLQEGAMQCGYRWMHQRCILEGYKVSRANVAGLLSVLDPIGVELRKAKRLRRREYFAKGPNYVWHLDSYDKLKPYGLCINGCIDGYSRKIICGKVTYSASDPRIIGGHYVTAIEGLNALPTKVRGDRGTENRYVEDIQCGLVDANAFIYGPSTNNQRIESFWRHLRSTCCQFWIELLGYMKDRGFFEGDLIDKNLVQFIFMDFVQNDIDQAVNIWNTHRIRQSRHTRSPGGRPCLYRLPDLEGTKDYSRNFDGQLLQVYRNMCLFDKNVPANLDMKELFEILMEENDLSHPRTIDEA